VGGDFLQTFALSGSSRERINRLKIKIKPNLVGIETALSASVQGSGGGETDRGTYVGQRYELGGTEGGKFDNSKTVTESKATDMKLSYRKEALHFKKKPKQSSEFTSRSSSQSTFME
jgi:hypothetical protein